MVVEKKLERIIESDYHSEFEQKSNEGFFQDEINNKNKMIWSEIGHIVYSNRKPEYSLSSILRRTNLFDDQEFNKDEETVNNEMTEKISHGEIYEHDKMDNYYGARKSKTLELLQVTDIIRNVHKEEVKIYLDEIAILRSQILQMSKNQTSEILNVNELENENKIKELEEKPKFINKVFEEKGTNTNIKLELQILDLIQILPCKDNKRNLKSSILHKIDLVTEDYQQLTEKNDYIQKLENLNIEIQRQLDLRNEQFSSVSLELVKQKSLLTRESENLRKSQQSNLEMETQLKQLLEKVSENEKYYLEQQELFNNENNSLNDIIQKLESEKTTLSDFLENLLKFTSYQIDNKIILESKFSDLLKNYSQNSFISQNYPNLIEFILIIDQILHPLKEIVLKKNNTKYIDSTTQTIIQPQIKLKKPKLKTERISNIFIQSLSNFHNQNYYEDSPIKSNYISENIYKKDILFKTNNERNLDFVSNVSATRLRNEINVLKNQLDASKQKLKLKDLENKKLLEEISYLKNKIIRNKTFNSSLSNQNLNYNFYENYKTIDNLKFNKSSKSKNYYVTSNQFKYADENWDEIFSVIQQLKGP